MSRDEPRYIVTGTTAGHVLQTAEVHGDVHLHAEPPRCVPRQLPGTVRHFVGRRGQLAALTAHVEQAAASPDPVAISTIEGMAGIGKSALAIHWAWQHTNRFPDGQLYVNLRGFSPAAAMQPGEALWGFLHALGAPHDTPSLDLDAQAALYRSMLAGRRMLIVLDNARDSDQVQHLLPGNGACYVIVTSRQRLTGLVAQAGARAIRMDGLDTGECAALLGALVGDGRVAAEPGATGELVEQCARMPLALTILGARLADRPDLAFRMLAQRLRDARLDTMDSGEPGVNISTVFSWSYDALSPAAATLFRLLSLHPGPDFSAAAATSIAARDADRLLDELTRVHLLETRPGDRYGFHDLTRLYARRRAHEDPPPEQDAAILRMLDHYLHTGAAADAHLGSPWEPVALEAPQPGTRPEAIADADQAAAWFAADHAVLVTLIEDTAWSSSHTWRLARCLVTHLDRHGHWRDFVSTQRAALEAVRQVAGPTERAYAHRLLARALIRRDEFAEARGHLDRALELFQDDIAGQAHTNYALGYLDVCTGDTARALEHTRHAFALARASGAGVWEAKALNNIGWCLLGAGHHAQALPYSRQALALFRRLDADPDGQAHTLGCLGSAYLGAGDPRRALACYLEALHIREQHRNHYTQATTLRHIATVHHVTGDGDAERSALRHALAILDRLGHAEAAAVREQLERLD
ncbi:tetratricopeptide (TPR) repeat protein [Amycolatopsis lexingtonensis]|uniref:Tetratricopeptide (TPR) repeat protein n=1 Tax=Amycolatopsis lexingtonensis TaxID=218822 RepID=A0ABR9HQQ6_9PSEU|nr:tetratricopeptide repeat protein [Amycolatopsis lexingtonensis]MBE1493251.1 tetratricopeptide (TPR) repeat protein [Amycolatopsis lexingtonensis]